MRQAAVAVSATVLALSLLGLFAPRDAARKGSEDFARRTMLPPTVSQASAPTAAKRAMLADLAWLEGRWQGEWGPRVAEQVWMSPRAGLMLGTFRLVEGGKTLLIELFSFLQKPDGIEFRFRHFTPDLAPWEKSDATFLTLESFDAKRFVFVNSVTGQPKRAIFTRLDQDTYVSRSEILPDGGGLQVIEIAYHREKSSAVGAAASHR